MYYCRLLDTSWGMVAYVAQDHKVVRVFLPPNVPDPKISRDKQVQIHLTDIDAMENMLGSPIRKDTGLLPEFARELQAYFFGKEMTFRTKFDLGAKTPFTKDVLMRVAKIPYGKTVSYADLAAMVGNPRAYRAAAQALGSNPVPLIIPCHRVIQSDGRLGGFTAHCGVAFKAKLLAMEQAS